MFRKVILGLVVSVGVLSAQGQICFKLEGKMGEEIKALIEKYKGSLEPVSIVNSGTSVANVEDMMAQVEAKIEEKKIKKAKVKKAKEAKKAMADGKKMYIAKCQTCHGEKAEKEAYGTSRPLNSLTFKEMEKAIVGYQLDEYDRGMAMIMKQHANAIMIKEVKSIHKYIQTLK